MKWLYGILCLFFLILFHEFGHFIAAKLFGVKVESFSIGFGPILLHKKIRGTDYRLSLIPLGGYCGMKGENDFRKALDENLKEIQAEPDSLFGIHPLKRAAIGFAGPFFNFIFAIVLPFERDVKTKTPALHGIVLDDFVMSVGQVQAFQFRAQDKLFDFEILADYDAVVSVAGKQIGIDVLLQGIAFS